MDGINIFDPLPPKWVLATLKDICLPVEQANLRRDYKGELHYIEVSGIDSSNHKITEAKVITASNPPSRAKQIVREGDTLFSNVRVYLEKIALIPKGLDKQIASTAFTILRPAQGINPKFLYFYVTTKPFIKSLVELQRGNSPPAVLEEDVRTKFFRIPPLNEQDRIVSQIDKLFCVLDKCNDNLLVTQKLLQRYRQSVVKATVTGELTREWREKSKGELESGEDLLARILMSRRKAWEEAELARMRAKGQKPKDNSWKQKYKEPVTPDTSELPELPEGWTWATIEQLSSGKPRSIQSGPFGSNLLHSEFQNSGILAIGIDNVQNGCFSLGSQNRISKEKYNELAKYTARPLDFLVTVMATVGRCAVVPHDLETAIITKHVYRVTLNTDFINPYFVMWCFLGCPSVKQQLTSYIRGQTRPGINGDILKKIAIPLPPTVEQTEAVDILNKKHSILMDFASQIDYLLSNSNKMRQSILKTAFSGKLVPQDPTDEPASELLKRIASRKTAVSDTNPKPISKQKRDSVPSKPAPTEKQAPTPQFNKQFAHGLAKARKAAGMSQFQLAKATGINQAYLSQMENSTRPISPDQAAALAAVLGVDADDLSGK